jgi:ubiquinone/menaquinone biosynthesis C-methylase UbiE
MPPPSVYRQTRYAERYDEEKYGGTFGRYLHDLEVETFQSLMDGSYGRILDVGAGTGKLSIPLGTQSRKIFSVDPSFEMLRVARRKAELEDVPLRPVIGDALHLCFRDEALDCAVSSRVLMHLPDCKQGLAEVCRVAKHMVIVDFPSVASFGGVESVFRRCRRLFKANTASYKVFRVGKIVRELERNNFRVVEVQKQFCLPLAFHRWLDRVQVSKRIEELCRMLGLMRILGSPVVVKAVRER